MEMLSVKFFQQKAQQETFNANIKGRMPSVAVKTDEIWLRRGDNKGQPCVMVCLFLKTVINFTILVQYVNTDNMFIFSITQLVSVRKKIQSSSYLICLAYRLGSISRKLLALVQYQPLVKLYAKSIPSIPKNKQPQATDETRAVNQFNNLG